MIYVELLDEGVPVWHPVPATCEGGSMYRLLPLSEGVMHDNVWAFPPASLVVAELRPLSDGPALVAVRLATATKFAAVSATASNQTGIDLLISRGPKLEAVLLAIERIAGIESQAVHVSGDPEERYVSIVNFPAWATVHTYAAGEFGFKVDLDGTAPRDYVVIARGFANALNCSIAWPDERTFATTAFITCAPDGKVQAVMIDDASDAACGFAVIQREDS
jgi:hypothetical protein